MGLYRTVKTERTCSRCGFSYPFEVQFKTANDWPLPEHADGEVLMDVDPGIYAGLGNAYCATCEAKWAEAERQAHFDAIAECVQSGGILARRAHTGGLTDPMRAEQVRGLATVPDGGGWSSLASILHDAGVELWADATRVCPPEGSAISDRWWARHGASVDEALRKAGWVTGRTPDIDVPVEVNADHSLKVRT